MVDAGFRPMPCDLEPRPYALRLAQICTCDDEEGWVFAREVHGHKRPGLVQLDVQHQRLAIAQHLHLGVLPGELLTRQVAESYPLP